MWIKIIGSMLVLSAASCCGFQLARRCSRRPDELRQIIGCVVSLKSYINYIAIPLPEALKKASGGAGRPVTALFHQAAARLEEQAEIKPQQAIDETLTQLAGRLALERPEQEILKMMGANLGSLNREEQIKHLQLVQEQLERIEEQAVKNRDMNVKMYRYLGVCGGLVVVLLLV